MRGHMRTSIERAMLLTVVVDTLARTAAGASVVMHTIQDGPLMHSNQEHYVPLVAFPGTCQQVSARSWCDGFLVGLDLKARAWVEHIEEDAGMRRVLCPIIALSTRFGAVLESAGRTLEDDADEQELEEMLPSAVLAAYNWWRIGAPRMSLDAPSAIESAII